MKRNCIGARFVHNKRQLKEFVGSKDKRQKEKDKRSALSELKLQVP